ncbi:hypothetical protein RI367_000827 [Sorochytrium milnesiophthora]
MNLTAGAAPLERDAAREAASDASIITAFSVYNGITALPMAQQRQRLPVFKHRTHILYLVERFQVLIVVGETGSGKTTQLPQYLHEAGWTANGQLVACTQPRRVAATSVARRVAEEMRVPLGEEVGYTIRFEDKSNPATTRIKYMTDGMLFREMMVDPLLQRYSVIMIDEAHERSLYTDIILGLLKKILRKRPELRIIVSSATLDAEMFAAFFNTNESGDTARDNVSIISLEGRMFPVDIYYLNQACEDYVERAVEVVAQIHQQEEAGDVLVFMTGREEIDYVVAQLKEFRDANRFAFTIGGETGRLETHSLFSAHGQLTLMPVPLYAGLSQEEQMKCFDTTPRGYRKVVVATNVAEASITIGGIVYVVDCGFVKAYEQHLPSASVPEMQRTNLAGVVLQLKSLGIENVARFEYLTPPPSDMMIRALELLYSLGALDEHSRLTIPNGMRMSELPVEPMLAKMLLAAVQFKCVREILIIAAMLSVENIFITPAKQRQEADEQRLRFTVEEGDHISYLNVYLAFMQSKQSSQWCAKRYLNFKSLSRAFAIRRQLAKYLQRYDIATGSTALDQNAQDEGDSDDDGKPDTTAIRKCIVSGFFAHAALAQPDGSYRTVRDGTQLWMHPSSCLFKRAPKCVVFHEVVETNRPFMRDVTAIEQDWLTELAPHFYERKSIERRYKTLE